MIKLLNNNNLLCSNLIIVKILQPTTNYDLCSKIKSTM